jgi:hypothetical protein
VEGKGGNDMNIDFEQLKTLVEAGDKSAFTQHIYNVLEKGDILTAATTNTTVKSELDSEKDKHYNTALETWKTNNLSKIIDEEVSKRNPTETPEQKMIADLQKKFEESENGRKREALMNVALGVATDKGLPKGILDKLLGDDETATLANIEAFATEYNTTVQAAVDAKFKTGGREPGKGDDKAESGAALFAKQANEQEKPVDNSIWK